MKRRIACLWFNKLSIERLARKRDLRLPFALFLRQQNAERIVALNDAAKAHGLAVGMGVSDAKAYCANLVLEAAQPDKDQAMLAALARLAQRFCPWVGIDGDDCLTLDLTGSAHLWGGEAGFVQEARIYFAGLGFSFDHGIAESFGAAFALAHYRPGIAEDTKKALADLPAAALRLSAGCENSLRRLGLSKIGALYDLPRAALARRFQNEVNLRLDQALGMVAEPINPTLAPQIFAIRLNLPEPIGLEKDVMAACARLIAALEDKLAAHGQGMRAISVQLRRVDGEWAGFRLRFARPMRQPKEILLLLPPKMSEIDAGFGFDLVRVEALDLIDWSGDQGVLSGSARAYLDLLSRIGNRIGFGNILKLSACASHLPEASFAYLPYEQTANDAPTRLSRPLLMFAPEMLAENARHLPERFTWRRMRFRRSHEFGPERIAPEWWRQDEAWGRGVRDYWRVATYEGRRLWLFYTPQSPAWYVQGEFV